MCDEVVDALPGAEYSYTAVTLGSGLGGIPTFPADPVEPSHAEREAEKLRDPRYVLEFDVFEAIRLGSLLYMAGRVASDGWRNPGAGDVFEKVLQITDEGKVLGLPSEAREFWRLVNFDARIWHLACLSDPSQKEYYRDKAQERMASEREFATSWDGSRDLVWHTYALLWVQAHVFEMPDPYPDDLVSLLRSGEEPPERCHPVVVAALLDQASRASSLNERDWLVDEALKYGADALSAMNIVVELLCHPNEMRKLHGRLARLLLAEVRGVTEAPEAELEAEIGDEPTALLNVMAHRAWVDLSNTAWAIVPGVVPGYAPRLPVSEAIPMEI